MGNGEWGVGNNGEGGVGNGEWGIMGSGVEKFGVAYLRDDFNFSVN
ncbi:MAG: hypothetical protein DSM106950_15455 [Stigonema ocellatum SAG 48.90 = DSM 106950]|nr:hypothetical protein [Stigonema ocellatum SAG 48.90 = DSM 106950]